MKIINLGILFLALGLTMLTANIKGQTSENLPSNIESEDCNKPGSDVSKGCYDIKKLRNKCASVTERVDDPEGEFNFRFERELRDAAGVNEEDDDKTTTLKITNMLKVLGNKLECNNGLSFSGGSILKVAVAK